MAKLNLVLFLMGLMVGASQYSYAAGGTYVGFNAGVGAPYLVRAGLNYQTAYFGADLTYNSTKLTDALTSISLTKPELMLRLHPFAGAFFMGVGFGQQTLSATATDASTSISATATVTSLTLTPTLGWMWGMTDGGLFVGMDVGYQLPFNAKTTITSTLATGNVTFDDVVKQGNKYGSTAYPVVTLLRLGYLF